MGRVMAVEGVLDKGNVVRFPVARRERPRGSGQGLARERAVDLVARLAPSRSWVDSLLAERGESPHDVRAGFAREFAYQVRSLEAGHGRDDAIVRLRVLVDAHVTHAVEVCRAYQESADRMVREEVEAAHAVRVLSPMRTELAGARAALHGRAIAARVAADAALGAATALTIYIREGLGGLPVSEAEPRQLLLFAAAVG